MASPKSGSWWVQWGHVARGLSQHQVCSRRWTNPFVVGFVHEASEWIACPHPSLISKAQHAPSTPSSAECWERALKSPHFCILETKAHPWAWLETWECVTWACDQGKGLQRCRPKVSPRVTFHALGNARECEGMNLHTPKWAPTLGHLGVGVSMDSIIFRGQFQGSKLIGLNCSLYHWKDLGT
jgi:hypothetical protein